MECLFSTKKGKKVYLVHWQIPELLKRYTVNKISHWVYAIIQRLIITFLPKVLETKYLD